MPGKGQLAFRSPSAFLTVCISCADNKLRVASGRDARSLACVLSRSEYAKVSHGEDETARSS
jgi:hypothetical protein